MGHLLPLVLLLQQRLGHDFSGRDLSGRHVLQLVAFREAALRSRFNATLLQSLLQHDSTALKS